MAEASPQNILMDFQSALADLQRLTRELSGQEEALEQWLRERAAETKVGKDRAEAEIERTRVAQRAARQRADRAKQAVDQLVKGVEDGSITIEPPLPGDAAAAAEIKALRDEAAANEAKLAGVAKELDETAKTLG